MDQFVLSCRTFRNYPQNLTQRCALKHTMAGYLSRLESKSELLFQDETVAVDFLDYRSARVKNQRELQLILSCRQSLTPEDVDPRCRFMSVTIYFFSTLS
jgi:hypothetical protein